MIRRAYLMMLFQLVDSDKPTARKHWRGEVWHFPDRIVEDPRRMSEIYGYWPDWRNLDACLQFLEDLKK